MTKESNKRGHNKSERNKRFKENFNRAKCLAPNVLLNTCNGGIIDAHTISRSRSLKAIERAGHVYGIKRTPGAFERNGNKARFELVGWKKEASTFRGFCKHHDDQLFAPIEKVQFQDNIESYFLVGYRGLCRELYVKEAAKTFSNDQVLETTTALACKEIETKKKELDDILISKDFSKVRAVVFSFDEPPPIMASFSIIPDFDFQNKPLQDLELSNGIEQDKRLIESITGNQVSLKPEYKNVKQVAHPELLKAPDIVCFNSFYDGKYGRVVFTWTESSDTYCNKLADSISKLNIGDTPAYFLQFMLGYSENCYIKPEWWETLLPEQRELIEGFSDQSIKQNKPPYSFFPDWANIPFPTVSETKFYL